MTMIQLKIDYENKGDEFQFTYSYGERILLSIILDFEQFSQMTQDMQKIVNQVNLLQAHQFVENLARSQKNVEETNLDNCQTQNFRIEGSSRESSETESEKS